MSASDRTLACVCAAKAPDAQLFETMNAQDLNKKLSELMDGLSVKAIFFELKPQAYC